jgi:hypothetical protein
VKRSGPGGVEAEDDLFEMANLFPVTTGLPMTVLGKSARQRPS